jgi:AsmA protein
VRATRWIVITLVAAAGLLAASVWLLTALVDAGRFRPQILAAVEAATGRALQIDGDVSLDVFPWLAVTVSDAALANPPGFASPELLRWSELSLGARVAPLLRGELELSRIRLTGARLQLERRADGVANWQGLGSAVTAADAQRRSTVLRSLEGIDLRDGSVTFVDAAAGTRVALRDLALTLPGWTRGAPLPLQLSGLIELGGQAAWPFALSTVLQQQEAATTLGELRGTLTWKTRPDARGLQLALATDRIEVMHEPVMLRGAPLEILIGTGATAQRDRIAIRDWRYVAGGPQSAASAQLELRLANLRRSLLDAGITPPYTTDPTALTNLRLTGGLRLAGEAWQVEPLEIVLDATTLRGRAQRAGDGVIELALAGDRMDLGRYLEPDDAPTPPFVFPTASLRALEMRATVTLEGATLGDAALEGVTLRLLHDAAGVRRTAAAAAPAAP